MSRGEHVNCSGRACGLYKGMVLLEPGALPSKSIVKGAPLALGFYSPHQEFLKYNYTWFLIVCHIKQTMFKLVSRYMLWNIQ